MALMISKFLAPANSSDAANTQQVAPSPPQDLLAEQDTQDIEPVCSALAPCNPAHLDLTYGVFRDTMFAWRPNHLRSREHFFVLLHDSAMCKLSIRNPFFLFPAVVEDLPRLCMQFLSCVDVRIDLPALALGPPAQDAGPLTLEETTSAHTLSSEEEVIHVVWPASGGEVACPGRVASCEEGAPGEGEVAAQLSWGEASGGGGQEAACQDSRTAEEEGLGQEDEERALDRLLLACEERRRARQRSSARGQVAAPVIVERAIGDNMASTFLFGLRLGDLAPAAEVVGSLRFHRDPTTAFAHPRRIRYTPYRSPHRRRDVISAQAREEVELRRMRITTFRQAVENLRSQQWGVLAPPPLLQDAGEHMDTPAPGLLRARDSLEVMLPPGYTSTNRYSTTVYDSSEEEEEQPPARRRRLSAQRWDRAARDDLDDSDSEYSESDPQDPLHTLPVVRASSSTAKSSSDGEDDGDEEHLLNKMESSVFIPIRSPKICNDAEASGSTKSVKRKVKFSVDGKTYSRKRIRGAPNVHNHYTRLDNMQITFDRIQELPENQSDEIISEKFENQVTQNIDNEPSLETMRYVAGRTESTIVNWPSDGECEEMRADARIAELSSDHEMVQILYNEISREMSAKSVTAESEGSPSKASLGAESPVFSAGTIQCHKVSGKLNINHQVLQETNDSTNRSSSILPAANECLQFQISAVPNPKSAQSEMSCQVEHAARNKDQGTVMFLRPSYVMIRATPSTVHELTRKNSSGRVEHIVIRNPECVLVKIQDSRNKDKQPTEAITDTAAGATDTDEDDIGK